MTENDELLVARFLARNTRDVPDDGFSDGVMRRLPVRSRPLYRIWTALCALLGVAFVVWARLWEGVGELFAGIAAHLRIEFDLGLSRVCDFLFSSHLSSHLSSHFSSLFTLSALPLHSLLITVLGTSILLVAFARLER